VLVIYRRHDTAFGIQQVHLGDHSQRLAGESHGAGSQVFFSQILGLRQPFAFFIHPFMLLAAFDCIGAFAKHSLYPFIEEQPRAVYEFIDHPRRQIVRKARAFRLARLVKDRESGQATYSLTQQCTERLPAYTVALTH
jgi:hypothetical protein